MFLLGCEKTTYTWQELQFVTPGTTLSILGYFKTKFKKLLLIFLSLPSFKTTKIPGVQYPT